MQAKGFRVFAVLSLVLALASGCGGGGGGGDGAQAGDGSNAQTPDILQVPSSASGCRSTATDYPWGRANPRTWTPRLSSSVPFEARLVVAFGDDSLGSPRQTVFEMADGCRRQFSLAQLSDADVAVVADAISAHASAADSAAYELYFEPGRSTQQALDNGTLVLHTTQHFAIWRGVDANGATSRSVTAARGGWGGVLEQVGMVMEGQWLWNRDLLKAPMPYAGGSARRKINVYVCGTGLPFVEGGDPKDCGAAAADAMWVGGWAILEPFTLSHEFGHVLQFYSGGFRDKAAAGPIWETGAQWNAVSLRPVPDWLFLYADNLESGPLFSHSRYGAYPFILHLHENDATRALVWKTWLQNKRTATGGTTEDYVQALVRLGQEAGAYPNGYRSFADDVGWYGARLAAMDFRARQALSDGLESADGTVQFVAKRFVPLATTAAQNVYTSPAARPLLEYGTHLVPLTAATGKVTAQVTGGTTANDASWRFALVAIAADGAVRYSKLAAVEGTATAATALDHVAGERLYLAVTATPYIYETLGWQGSGPTTGTQFPYRVRFANAVPMTGSTSACNPSVAAQVRDFNYNTNGHSTTGVNCGQAASGALVGASASDGEV